MPSPEQSPCHSPNKLGILSDLNRKPGPAMHESSLVPERQLVFSPGLAATIGLEEAILLQAELLELLLDAEVRHSLAA